MDAGYVKITNRALAEALHSLCYEVGEDPGRDGLKETAQRVARAWREMTRGYCQDPSEILSTTFEQREYNEMIVLRNVQFTSLCEHHLMPFSGHATLAYIPGEQGRVVGLSKLARLVNCFALRLQIQERLTCQLTSAMWEYLAPAGCAAIITAEHSCMGCRGVLKPGSVMLTSSLRGVMLSEADTRAEVFALAR